MRIEFEDYETGDEIGNIGPYVSYEIKKSFVGANQDGELVFTHRVMVHSETLFEHYDVMCEAGDKCTRYDHEVAAYDKGGGAWWDTVPEPAGDDSWNLPIAVAYHLNECKGPLRIEKVK